MVRPSRTTMVYVSALALLAPIKMVSAAPTISCTRNISFGRFLPLCNGNITVRASSGSGTANNGCHSLIAGAIRPAVCNIQTTLGTATQDARITFTTNQLAFSNNTGAGLVTLDNFVIETAGGSQAGSHTFTAALLNPTHTFNVGGRLRFDLAEPSGTYSSTLNVVVTSIP